MVDNPFRWSYSSLKNFETCPKRHYHYDIARDIKEPESQQLKDGNDLHAAFEARIKTGAPLPLGVGQWETVLQNIVSAPGATHGEQKLAITSEFTPCAYFAKNVWLRVVIDAAKINGEIAVLFDWKTGKPTRDMTQMQIFAAAMFHCAPAVQRVKTALVFLKHDIIERAEFVRSDVTEIWSEILPRVKKLQQARQSQEYPPKPGGLCKRWCEVVSCPHHGGR